MSQLDDLHRLREEASVLAQQVEQARRRQRAATGQDEAATVRVTVDADGTLVGVTVSQHWREQHQPAGLTAAVQEAYLGARTAGMEQAAQEYDQLLEQPLPLPRPNLEGEVLMANLEALGAGSGACAADAAAVLEELLEGLLERLDTVDAALALSAGADHPGRSGAGHVRAVVGAGGEIRELQIDQRWLEGAHEVNVGREITQAVRAALADRAAAGAAALLDAQGLGAIARLATDPGAAQELLARR